ncbi:hypothetical protein STEG23_018211, partial [Scotinomys teguina]
MAMLDRSIANPEGACAGSMDNDRYRGHWVLASRDQLNFFLLQKGKRMLNGRMRLPWVIGQCPLPDGHSGHAPAAQYTGPGDVFCLLLSCKGMSTLQVYFQDSGFGKRALELGFWNQDGLVDSDGTQLEKAKKESKGKRTRRPTPPQASACSAPYLQMVSAAPTADAGDDDDDDDDDGGDDDGNDDSGGGDDDGNDDSGGGDDDGDDDDDGRLSVILLCMAEEAIMGAESPSAARQEVITDPE